MISKLSFVKQGLDVKSETRRIIDPDQGGSSYPKLVKTKCLLLIAMTVLLSFCPHNLTYAANDQPKEYQIKMAFIVNILKFVEWQESSIKQDQPFIIAVFGNVPLSEGIREIPDIQMNKHKVMMQVYHVWDPNSENQTSLLHNCQTLFITKSEQRHISSMFDIVHSREVMTVGECPEFIDKGGIFNFEVEKNKVRFSVSLINAEKAKLSIRSKLLRLAKQVYK